MLPEKASTLQDFQQTHSQAKLLMYAKYEIHHIVTQQTRSFQCKCPNTATRHQLKRYRNHKTSFRHSKRRNETQLSKYVWNLQSEKKPFQIKWKILKKGKPYSNVSKKCSLCLNEKFIIICQKELCSLNRRNELASSCPHRNRYVLGNFRVT